MLGGMWAGADTLGASYVGQLAPGPAQAPVIAGELDSPFCNDLEEQEAPLLQVQAGCASGGGAAGGAEELPVLASAEGKRILAIGAPLCMEEVLSYSSTMISLAYAGRLGARPLSIFSLSHSLTNITGIALLNGVTGALDTFGSQAHGSRSFPAVGLALQRALLLSLLTCLPLMALYGASPWVLRSVLGQEADLAAAAGRYTRIFALKIPLHACILCMYRCLASQGAAGYVLAGSATYFLATAPINHLLIFNLGWGLDGSAAAAVACEAVYAAALVMLCTQHNSRQPPAERWWRGWQAAALADWGPFIRLSAAATAMIVADWWLYDILTLLAGLLPDPEVPLAATGILYNIQALVFMMPFGLAYAVCARVGHHLGARRPRTAKLAASMGFTLGMLLAGLLALLLLLGRNQAPALFTSDPAVLRSCSTLMLPLAAVILANGSTALLSGILRGAGRQRVGAIVNASVNYLAGLPLMVLLSFVLRYGVHGLWWGITAAAVLQVGLLAFLVRRFDWHREAARAAKLVHHLSTAGEPAGAGAEGWEPGEQGPVEPAFQCPPLL